MGNRSRSPVLVDYAGRPNPHVEPRQERQPDPPVTHRVGNLTAMFQPAPFKGDDPKEDFEAWIVQLRAAMAINEVPEDKKLNYLTLKLAGGAFTFFTQLKHPQNYSFENAVQALTNRYLNPNDSMMYKIEFRQRDFKVGKETVENYVAQLTKIANKAFPNKEQGRASIVDRFIEGMPKKIKKKCLMMQDPSIQQLQDYVSKILCIDDYCPGLDAGAFNAVTPVANNSAIYHALNEIQSTQVNLHKQSQQTANTLQGLQKKVEDESLDRRQDAAEIKAYKRDKDQARKPYSRTPSKPYYNYPTAPHMQQNNAYPQHVPAVQIQPIAQEWQQPQQPQAMQAPVIQQQPATPQVRPLMAPAQNNFVPAQQQTPQVPQQAQMHYQPNETFPQNNFQQQNFPQNAYQQNQQQRYGSGFQRSHNLFCHFCGIMGHKQMDCRKRMAARGTQNRNQKN